MRALNTQQATACENATTSRCRCRCRGQMHGAGRGEVIALPLGDPHRVDLPAELDVDAGGDGIQLALFDLGPPRAADRLAGARIRLLQAIAEREAIRRTRRPSSRSGGRTARSNGIAS